MPNIKKIAIESKTITGLQVRTKNADETHVKTQKITPLWEKFSREVMTTVKEDATVYGIYHNYESDVLGAFDVTVGADMLEKTEELKEVTLHEGRYLVFPARGEQPQAIIETWKQVWAYFDDPSIDERRAYETDFELYKTSTEVDIYIGVHYF